MEECIYVHGASCLPQRWNESYGKHHISCSWEVALLTLPFLWRRSYPPGVQSSIKNDWELNIGINLKHTFASLVARKKTACNQAKMWRHFIFNAILYMDFAWTVFALAGLGAVAYVLARVYLVLESFISLMRVPMGIYQTPEMDFIGHIPHFW